MSIKGYIKLFAVLFTLAAAYQLIFTFAANRVESRADDFAKKGVVETPPAGLSGAQKIAYEDSVMNILKGKKRYFLDSVSNETVLNLGLFKYNYRECQDRKLKLGLDLRGGVSMVLELSEDELLKKLSNNNPDPAFNKAIKEAVAAGSNSNESFIKRFQRAYETANPNAKLAAIFGSVQNYNGKINFSSSNRDVINVLSKDIEEAEKSTYNVLKTRLDQFGVGSTNISQEANSGRIIVEMPGVDDPARIRKILSQTAQLEFWDTYENDEVISMLVKADEDLGSVLFNNESVATDIDTTAAATADVKDTTNALSNLLSTTKSTTKKDSSFLNPIRSKLQLMVSQEGRPQEGPIVGMALGRDTAKINAYLAMPQAANNFSRDLKFMWGAKPFNDAGNAYALYAIKVNPSMPDAPLNGDAITNANSGFDPTSGTPQVDLTMNAVGASTWERMTEQAAAGTVNGQPRKKCIAIVMDDRVFSAPRVQNKISGGRSQITGINDIQEAADLANILKSGKLETKTNIVEEQVVGPSLGKEAIRAGLLSLLAAFVIVMLFMLAYYTSSALIAIASVILNMFLIVGCLAAFGASLTLPGLAGVVLTLAMAVDANVIINERIREEIRKGKGLLKAIEDGYRHSLSAIFDGNITTFIVAVILMFFGLGPIKGFAVTLLIGVLTTLFTAVGVSWTLFDLFTKRNKELKFGTAWSMKVFDHLNFDFMGKRKLFYTISAVAFAVSLIGILAIGFDYGVDFQGGRSFVVKFDKEVSTTQITQALEKTFGNKPLVKTYGSNSQIQITTAYLINKQGQDIDRAVEAKLYDGIAPFFAEKPSMETFVTKNIKSVTTVQSSVADDIRNSAWLAGILGTLGIFLYIFLRFAKIEYAIGAIVALLHDPVIVLGLFAWLRHIMPFSLEIDQHVVAAVLTLLGYSINDTVIVFDRIREYLKIHPSTGLTENVNNAINSTLSRTLITSFVTELAVITLFLFGGDSIRQFSFALMVGVAIGTYSSIYIAAPIVVDLMLRRENKKA